MDKVFEIHSNFEKDGVYYIETDYGELTTTNKSQYDKVIKDGFIILKLEDWEEAY